MSTVWAHDSLTIMARTSVFDNWCVMFCNSVSITTHTDMLVMRNHRRDDGGQRGGESLMLPRRAGGENQA